MNSGNSKTAYPSGGMRTKYGTAAGGNNTGVMGTTPRTKYGTEKPAAAYNKSKGGMVTSNMGSGGSIRSPFEPRTKQGFYTK
jgi:hypothetical protein